MLWNSAADVRRRSIRVFLCAVILTSATALMHAQSDATVPRAFEVATIKLTPADFTGRLIQNPGPGTIAFRGFTVTDLIGFAFDVDTRQVLSVPRATDAVRYHVVGRSTLIQNLAAPDTRTALHAMVQALLRERFKLTVHQETRDVPVYAMHIAMGGHKLRPRADGDGGAPTSMIFQGANLPARNVPISLFADGLQKLVLDRPVVDKTGLRGNFDFDLSWRPDTSQFNGRGGGMPAASDPDRADIFTALQEQLGLKLEPEKAQATVIVVDTIERPSQD